MGNSHLNNSINIKMRSFLVFLLLLLASCDEDPIKTVNCDAGVGTGCEQAVLEKPGRLYVDPPFGLGFSCVHIGCDESQLITLENRGELPISISRIRLTLDTSSDFLLHMPNLDTPSFDKPLILKGGGKQIVQVRYRPLDSEADQGKLWVSWFRAENNGEIIDAEIPLATRVLGSAQAELLDPILIYNFVDSGESSSRYIEIKNTASRGSQVLDISSFKFAVEEQTSYRLKEQLPIFINPQESVKLAVEFRPELRKAYIENLYLKTNDGAQPQLRILLKATSLARSKLMVLEPESQILDFGEIRLNGEREKNLKISNYGDETLRFELKSIVSDEFGNELAFKTVQHPLGTRFELESFEEIEIPVSFKAIRGGILQAQLILTSFENGHETKNIVHLSAAVLDPMPIFSVETLNFGDVVQSWSSEAQEVVIRNVGHGELLITDIDFELASSAQVQFAQRPVLPVKLSGDESMTFSVFVNAQTLGPANATLKVFSNAVDAVEHTIDVVAEVVTCQNGCALSHASADCTAGYCQIESCIEGYSDADESSFTGCECASDPGGEVGANCLSGQDIGPLGDKCSGNQQNVVRTGTLEGPEDVDLYHFFAEDDGSVVCDVFGDSFGISVEFIEAPVGMEFCYRAANVGCGGENQRTCGFQSARFNQGTVGGEDNTHVTVWVRFAPEVDPQCGEYSILFSAMK